MRTDVENVARKAAVEKTVRGAVELMRAEGITLDAEEGHAVQQLLMERLAVLNAENMDAAAFSVAAANAAFDVVDAVRAASLRKFAEAVGVAGREATERAITLGGYRTAPPGALMKMNKRLGKLVADAMTRGQSREDIIQAVREGATRIVRELFGPPPAPARMN